MNSSTIPAQQTSAPSSITNIWIGIFGVLALATVVLNALTILTFKRISRHRFAPAQIYLINLAVADLLVGILAVPMYIVAISGHGATEAYDLAFRCIDMMFSLTSIFLLIAVALERLCAVYQPVRFREIRSKAYLKSLAIPWGVAAVVSISNTVSRALSQYYRENVMCHVVLTSLALPLVTMCSLYTVLWIKMKRRQLPRKTNIRDKKVAIAPLIAMVVLLVTWLPFFLLMSIFSYCPTCLRYFPHVVESLKFLHYSNSFVNPIIYYFRIQNFKTAMFTIITCGRSQPLTNKRAFRMRALSSSSRASETDSIVSSFISRPSLHFARKSIEKEMQLNELMEPTSNFVQLTKHNLEGQPS